jgi:sulfite exporter TauE/SafE
MCGSLVVSAARTRLQIARYHLGRLASYSALGALAGGFGHALLGDALGRWLAWVAAVTIGVAFVALGVQSWRGGGAPHLQLVPARWLKWLYRRVGDGPLALGALSALLPCGWLHSFVLASAATQSAWRGGALMAVFWLGTVPALAAAPWTVRRVLGPLQRFAPRATAVLLIAAGLAGVGFKMRMLTATQAGGVDPAGDGIARCHCHHGAQSEFSHEGLAPLPRVGEGDRTEERGQKAKHPLPPVPSATFD